MPDQTQGGGPTFEEPDFSKYSGGDEAEDLETDDEVDNDLVTDEDEDENEASDEDVVAVAAEESGTEPDGNTVDGNTAEGGTAASVLEHVAASIVDDTESVVVETKQVRGQLRLYLHVAPGDMGRIIGRRGRTAQAVRTLVRAAAAAEGHDAFVEIVD